MTKPKKQKQYQINKNKYLSDESLDQLRSTLSRYKNTDKRNTTLIKLILDTGARSQEALNLLVSDIDFKKRTVFIKGIKNSNDRELPINKDLINRLKPLVREKSRRDRIFNISRVMLFKIWQNYRPEPKGIHSLRHSFAINLYKKTRDIRLVQVALGHRSIANTMVYSEYIYSTEELQKILEPNTEEAS